MDILVLLILVFCFFVVFSPRFKLKHGVVILIVSSVYYFFIKSFMPGILSPLWRDLLLLMLLGKCLLQQAQQKFKDTA